MKIRLENLGKRYNRDWIFRHLNHEFTSGKSYAITGPNGSGKSTLLQVIAGYTIHNEGSIHYHNQIGEISGEKIFGSLSIVAPYLELIEEMTLQEFLTFHTKLKPLLPGTTIKEIASIVSLENAINKEIRYYSSGMKQRLKLAQAIFSDVPLLFLDEPCTNLDKQGIGLYRRLIDEYCKERLVFVSSNDVVEYEFCDEVISVQG
jgi:ABC-type multidrug transport system ATPase subunit